MQVRAWTRHVGKSAYGTSTTCPRGRALQALPIGLVYLLIRPFPGHHRRAQLLVLAETLVWYALMPAFVRGLTYSIRQRLGCAADPRVHRHPHDRYALMQATSARRTPADQVTMFFFVFMAVGIVQGRRRAARDGSATRRLPSRWRSDWHETGLQSCRIATSSAMR